MTKSSHLLVDEHNMVRWRLNSHLEGGDESMNDLASRWTIAYYKATDECHSNQQGKSTCNVKLISLIVQCGVLVWDRVVPILCI